MPFFSELFVNGLFILLFAMRAVGQLPKFIPAAAANTLIETLGVVAPLVILFTVLGNLFKSSSVESFLRNYVFSIVVFIPMVVTYGDLEFTFWLSSAHLLSSILALYDPKVAKVAPAPSRTHWAHKIHFSAAQILFFSFFVVIILGCLLLMLPVAVQDGIAPLKAIDALFLATSATTVTGLTPFAINTHLSTFGQMVLLTLVQIGGLGIMTFSASLAILLGKGIDIREKLLMQDLLGADAMEDVSPIIFDILRYALIIEAWGAIVLTVAFTLDGLDLGQALYFGIFHAISAFCNAGLCLFDSSLQNYGTNPLVAGTVAVMIFLGGLGFITLKEVKEIITGRRRVSNLSLNSKVVLTVSLSIIAVGTVFIFFSEFLNGLDGFSVGDKFQIALFQAVSVRTAGFTTIDFGNFHPQVLYVFIWFMAIGAGPGSTGGGIKTTTFAILVSSITSTLKGRKQVQLFHRVIPNELVVRSIALTFIYLAIAVVFIFILMLTEQDRSFLAILFEVVSAEGTVGASIGLTGDLTRIGKFVISILMFIGRIGPLTLVLAIGQHRDQADGSVTYPEGRIMIG
ncbi:MAG: hypothetical protein J6Y94_04665 [Bacteriovoracaceae bacterium]|nr:hypothetical protein [Bacteriovoracaceae bacterium]